MDKNAFVKATQEHLQAYLDSKADDWMPPASDYLCVGAGFRTVEWENRSGVKETAILPYVQIISHPELEGRKFRLGFFPVSGAGRIGVLLCPTTHAEPADMSELYDALCAAFGGCINDGASVPPGKIMTIGVKTNYSKKEQRDYTNASIRDYPDVQTEETPPTQAPTPEAPAAEAKKAK